LYGAKYRPPKAMRAMTIASTTSTTTLKCVLNMRTA